MILLLYGLPCHSAIFCTSDPPCRLLHSHRVNMLGTTLEWCGSLGGVARARPGQDKES